MVRVAVPPVPSAVQLVCKLWHVTASDLLAGCCVEAGPTVSAVYRCQSGQLQGGMLSAATPWPLCMSGNQPRAWSAQAGPMATAAAACLA